jgi:hypothetical protein
MKSIRLDPTFEARLESAAQVSGESVSVFMKKALENRICEVESGNARNALARYIGAVSGTGPSVAERTGEAFTELLEKKAGRKA